MSRLQTRVLLAVFAVSLAAVTAVALAARHGARTEFLKFQDVERHAEMTRRADNAAALAHTLDHRCCTPDSLAAVSARLDPHDALLVIADGGPLAGSAGVPLALARDVTARFNGHELQIELTRQIGQRLDRVSLQFLLAGAPLTLADGRQAAAFVVPMPADTDASPAAAFLGLLDRQLLLVTMAVGLAALVATWFVTRGAMGPLADLRQATADLAGGHFARRVRTDGPEEIAALATSFNAMATELERQQSLRRNLVHDVAHELRTPLTALRCRLETVQDGLAADPAAVVSGLHEQVLHLSQLVDDLQELALAESRELRLQMADVDLGQLAASALRASGMEDDARVRKEIKAGLAIHADAVRMRQVLTNLLTNAARHTPENGTIAVRGYEDGARVAVEVHNTGSALDPEQLAHVFDRFYRTDPSRQRDTGGSGLGLAIVKHLVEAQGGRVWASSDAGGVTVGFDAGATPSPALPSSAPSAPASGA